ncbi:MAG: sodium-dependent transporter [Xanthomonadaceae bacterium]|nr:sodium-dependent transporter [Xanthomonadaceae bacterium]
MLKRVSIHGNWSSRMGFVLAATGAAVGLGNIWKFPYITGENGGGAFVLVYLACVVAVGLPVMIAEMVLGRRGRRNPIGTMKLLSEEESRSSAWRFVGWLGVATGMLILSYYSVVAGWTLSYTVESISGAFRDAGPEEVGAMFSGLLASPLTLLAWHTLFMGMTVFVVARGVQHGLEAAVRYLMPVLLVLLLVLVGYAMTTGHFMEGVHFLFDPDFSKLTPAAFMIALGQAFFTLSIGMGAIMAYGAYLPEDTAIAPTAATVVAADTTVALLAGLAIFPLVFANGLNPGEGPGLIFQTLPLAFGMMPGGVVFGTLFFLLLVVAAWTSAIGLIEPAVAYLVESRSMPRRRAALLIGGSIWLLGFATVFSFNVWSDLTVSIGDRAFTMFDGVEFFTSNIALPLGGLLIAVFAGWVMSKGSTLDEFERGASTGYATWRLLVRWVAPAALLIVFLQVTGLVDITNL